VIRPIALAIEYDGTNYVGWQLQPNGISIQQRIEDACHAVFGVEVRIIGSGRTDTGVHARLQVAHCHIANGNNVPLSRIPRALNTNLPFDIRIRAAADVQPTFHARFDPDWREYVYRIALNESVFQRHFYYTPQATLDLDAMQSALNVFEGEHDFTTFSKQNADTKSYVCSVSTCTLEQHDSNVTIRIRANRFVYGMCRSIVGAAMDAARGSCTTSDIRKALQSNNRSLQSPLAPPHGLILNRVHYPSAIFDHLSTF